MIFLSIVGAFIVERGGGFAASRFNPFGPPDLSQPPTLLTRYQLSSLERDNAFCRDLLSESDVAFEPLADRQTGEGCGFDGVVRLTGEVSLLSPAVPLTCRMAAAYTMFQQFSVQPLAEKHFAASAESVRSLGSYACRNINNALAGRRSEHAQANALDISGIVLSDGTEIDLLRDWNDPGAKGAFLHELAKESCRYFNLVLGPDDNAAHRNHFHFDSGPFRRCRY